MAVSGWIADFSRRLNQLATIATLDSLNNIEVWLGGLFFPEAYITATRQAVAHRKKWSLETLRLRLDIERVNRVYQKAVSAEKELADAEGKDVLEPLPEDAAGTVIGDLKSEKEWREIGLQSIARGEVGLL